MKITAKLLQEKGGCTEGIETFEAEYPTGLLLSRWTRAEQIRVLRTPLGKYLGWGVRENMIPWWSMIGADLRRSNLSRSNLSRSNLSRSNLSWSDLRGCNLSGCDLSGCDLSGCNLSRSNLSWSDLRGCDLSGCDLSGCDLYGCNLSGCDLSGCDLSGCNLSRAYRPTGAPAGWKPDAHGRLERAE